MNFMTVCLLAQWFEALSSKLVVMLYQVGFFTIGDPAKVYISWWTSDLHEMIPVKNYSQIIPLAWSGLLIWHYVYSMFIGVITLGFERICATWFIRDYEKTPRRHISIVLLILVHCTSLPFSYFLVHNQISFILADVICILCVSTLCIIYASVYYINLKMLKNVNMKYRLPVQYQAKENIKHIMLARNMVVCATLFVAIACGLLMLIVLDLIPTYLKNPLAHCAENCIFLNPLLICTVMTFSIPAWKNEMISAIPCSDRLRHGSETNQESLGTVEETEVYFNQLRNAWT